MNHGLKIMVLVVLTIFICMGAAACLCPFTWQSQKAYKAGNEVQDNGETVETKTIETGEKNDRDSEEFGSSQYTGSEIEYFFETVFGAEYGDTDYTVHKWADDIRIDVKGDPTGADMETLDEVLFELNYLIDDIDLSLVSRNGDIEIYFDSQSNFSYIEPNYVPGNSGFFWAWWDGDGNLYKARVLIAAEGVTQDERSHLIWEELTQCLGIMNDSYEYSDSIFYQEWTDVQGLSDIDKAVVTILYDPRIESGMSMHEVSDIIYGNN